MYLMHHSPGPIKGHFSKINKYLVLIFFLKFFSSICPQLVGYRWQVASGRWQVAGERWLGAVSTYLTVLSWSEEDSIFAFGGYIFATEEQEEEQEEE